MFKAEQAAGGKPLGFTWHAATNVTWLHVKFEGKEPGKVDPN